MQPSVRQFLIGMGSVMMILPNPRESGLLKAYKQLPENPSEAFQRDWKNIAGYFQVALQKLDGSEQAR